MEEGKQGKEGVGMNGYRVGKNGGVGRERVVGKKEIKGRSGRKEMRYRRTECGEQVKEGYEKKKGRKRRRDRKEKRGMMGKSDRNEWKVGRNGGEGEVGRNGGGWKEGIGWKRGIGRNGRVEKIRGWINEGIGKNKGLDGKDVTKEKRDRKERRGGIREEEIGGNG